MSHGKDWLTVLKAYQIRSAREVVRWLPLMLDDAGIDADAAGVASIGPLLGMTGQGWPAEGALAHSPSRAQRDRLMQTVLLDAARQMTAVGIAARPAVTGYVRVVEGGACSRCIILAGRYYRWSQGFLRHPHCACTHSPSNRARDAQDPRDLFDRLPKEEQDRRFTAAGAEAIRMGADISRVVNASKGVQYAQMFGRAVKATPTRGGMRLMPESILAAAQDRDQAIALLRAHGYLT